MTTWPHENTDKFKDTETLFTSLSNHDKLENTGRKES